MEIKTKAVFLKLKPKKYKQLLKMKLNYSAFYGVNFTWEDYVCQIADAVDAKLSDLEAMRDDA